ncbi:hypothetical protein F0U62_23930 [Cystobacter fuscus]|uniref:lipase family protein n=1 Tax=Cystobacter fuscus TaxID=43 RepID=UPI002B2BD080|nr:hypothetical protein F0U62_23930 [Cystobacter fuscus]
MSDHNNKSHVIFIGGGGDKELKTHIVKNISEQFKNEVKKNINITTSYHGWMSETVWNDDVAKEILELKKKDPSTYIAVVGHSYGGSAAVNAAQSLDRMKQTEQVLLLYIDLMITLDPVSRLHSCPSKRPESVRYWINIDADEGKFSMNNLIASIGGNWGDKVKALADVYFDSKLDHAYAKSMLTTPYELDGTTYTAWDVLLASAQWGTSDRGPKPRGGFSYAVRQKDTLWAISSHVYGKASYWWLIRDANPKAIPKGSTLIRPGMNLFIPAVLDEVKVIAKRMSR